MNIMWNYSYWQKLPFSAEIFFLYSLNHIIIGDNLSFFLSKIFNISKKSEVTSVNIRKSSYKYFFFSILILLYKEESFFLSVVKDFSSRWTNFRVKLLICPRVVLCFFIYIKSLCNVLGFFCPSISLRI